MAANCRNTFMLLGFPTIPRAHPLWRLAVELVTKSTMRSPLAQDLTQRCCSNRAGEANPASDCLWHTCNGTGAGG